MTKHTKALLIEELKKQIAGTNFYVTDSQGLTVAHANSLRRLCYQKNIVYRVVKNTLLKKTLDHLGLLTAYPPLQQKVLKGVSSLFITKEDPSQPAKILHEFYKTHDLTKPLLKGALIEGELFIGPTQLDTLSKLKSKKMLIAELVGLLQSPIQRLVAALQNRTTDPQGNFVNLPTQ